MIEMSIEDFSQKYIKPAVDDLWKRVQSGEPVSEFEANLIKSLGRESATWALNVKSGGANGQ